MLVPCGGTLECGGPRRFGSFLWDQKETTKAAGTAALQSAPEGGERGASSAVLALESGDTCVRWCGAPADVIGAVVRTALGAAGGGAGLLASHYLAPNHWFSAGLTAPADAP